MDWPHLIGEYGYAAIVLGTFVEGEAALAAGGFAASQGWLDPWLVFACGSLGVLISDQAWFWAARRFGRRLLVRWPRLRLRVASALAAIERHQVSVAVGFQFAPGACTVTPIAFGLSGIAWPRFLALDLAGIALWSALMVTCGMASAAVVDWLRRGFATAGWWLAGGALIAVAIWIRLRQRRARSSTAAEAAGIAPP